MRAIASLTVVLAVLFCASCDKDNPAGADTREAWTITLAGDLTGGGDMIIDDAGKFSDTWTMRVSSNTYSTLLTGNVSGSGMVNGTISISGSKVGDIAGNLGTNTGNGTYQLTQPDSLNGTWSAVKK